MVRKNMKLQSEDAYFRAPSPTTSLRPYFFFLLWGTLILV